MQTKQTHKMVLRTAGLLLLFLILTECKQPHKPQTWVSHCPGNWLSSLIRTRSSNISLKVTLPHDEQFKLQYQSLYTQTTFVKYLKM